MKRVEHAKRNQHGGVVYPKARALARRVLKNPTKFMFFNKDYL